MFERLQNEKRDTFRVFYSIPNEAGWQFTDYQAESGMRAAVAHFERPESDAWSGHRKLGTGAQQAEMRQNALDHALCSQGGTEGNMSIHGHIATMTRHEHELTGCLMYHLLRVSSNPINVENHFLLVPPKPANENVSVDEWRSLNSTYYPLPDSCDLGDTGGLMIVIRECGKVVTGTMLGTNDRVFPWAVLNPEQFIAYGKLRDLTQDRGTSNPLTALCKSESSLVRHAASGVAKIVTANTDRQGDLLVSNAIMNATGV